MNDIQWNIKTFQELESDQLYDLLKLRVEVFVAEQQCAYRELDEYDRHPEARHISGRNEGGELIAYARILPPGLRHPEVNLGRFVVKADFRKQGIGHQLLQTALQSIAACWPEIPIKMSAQSHLHRFYAQYGFLQVTDGYLEDGIPHVEMVKEG
ncbi:GNAT family N-acetyltransferase [Nitrospira sp. T9]|uniref:GNAT family N-acetyltransferase n=1 Tax=unclassified Nitrospira TaxID=2652172 RepID=UPI003F9DD59C